MTALFAGTILFMTGTASAQQGSPAFRVPIGGGASSSSNPPIYAWLESISECTSSCGAGTRTTSFQCQNASEFDYSGTGYGAPEADALCTSSVGPKPSSTNSSCTNYSGCGYDWVKPPVQQTPVQITPNPIGRIGCGKVRAVFSPYCQRTGGASSVVLPASDHRFCRNDTPDYNQVAAGDPDALGYDRFETQLGSCVTVDHEWRAGGWGTWSDTCSNSANHTRTVGCYRRFDNQIVADSSCDAATKPASSETQGIYTSCSFDWINADEASWSPWSSTCSNTANRTRNPQCRRSNGDVVADSSCVNAGKPKPSTTQTQAVYSSCTYSAGGTTTNGAWSSTCSSNASRSVTRQCIRSNGDVVADSECANRSVVLTTTQTQAVYDSCSYAFDAGSWSDWNSHCSNGATRTRSVTCRRSDGTGLADAECTNRGISKPASSDTQGVYDQCSYAAGGSTTYGGWTSACSSNAQRSVTRQCIRSDGSVVSSAECTNRGVAVTSTQTGAVYDGCGYGYSTGGWSDWNSHCSGSATRTRSVQCLRSDGTAVSDAECANRGIGRPASSETTAVYDACGFSAQNPGAWSDWNSHCSANASRSRSYQCVRADGSAVAAAECTNRGIGLTESQNGAVYDGCGYSFATGGWSDWNSHCSGSATRTRAVTCYRADGTGVPDAECVNRGIGRPASSETTGVYDGCGYARGAYTSSSDWNSHCSGSAVRTNYYNCNRSDGAVVGSTECTNRGIAVTEQQSGAVYDQCGYSAVNWTGFSACTNSQQTSTAQCQRSDGAMVAASECTNRGVAVTRSQSCTSGWPDWSCNNSQTVAGSGDLEQISNCSFLVEEDRRNYRVTGADGIPVHPQPRCASGYEGWRDQNEWAVGGAQCRSGNAMGWNCPGVCMPRR
jgi:hypothetical protein